ncbi:MAG TPA: SET domain-containing protein [Polyangiaceae bacterium]|nr:SET domain-containing protein [Polyangiaceae bacterium]
MLVRLGTSEARGRGVYAAVDIAEGTLIEECPVVVIAPDEVGYLQETALRDYFFVWGGVGDAAAIALGYGSLYNHASVPNAMYVRKHEALTIAFFALRAIAAGEEITVSYHGGFGDRGDVWFDVR